jgi:hypothetical protein
MDFIDSETIQIIVAAAPQLLEPEEGCAFRSGGQEALNSEGDGQLGSSPPKAVEALQKLASFAECGSLEVTLTHLALDKDLIKKLVSSVCGAWDKCSKAQLEAAEESLATSEAMVLGKARSSREGARQGRLGGRKNQMWAWERRWKGEQNRSQIDI